MNTAIGTVTDTTVTAATTNNPPATPTTTDCCGMEENVSCVDTVLLSFAYYSRKYASIFGSGLA